MSHSLSSGEYSLTLVKGIVSKAAPTSQGSSVFHDAEIGKEMCDFEGVGSHGGGEVFGV